MKDENKALALVKWVSDRAIDGMRPLSSAHDLAEEYVLDLSYANPDERVRALIKWETTKNFTSGFISGLGGLLTLPVAIPAAFGASWIIQARMVAAIARLYGHNLHSDRVRTFIMAVLVGDSLKEIAKASGITIARGFTKTAIEKVPGRVLIEINKRVGFRMLTKAGEKGAINLMKGVPFVGGFVSGLFDAGACNVVGLRARKAFRPKSKRRRKTKCRTPKRRTSADRYRAGRDALADRD